MSTSNVRTGSMPAATASSSSSALRPRPNRLISGLSEGDETLFDSDRTPPRRIASPLNTPYDSRSVSPIPAPHPQRLTTGRTSQRHADDGRSRTTQLGGQSRDGSVSPTSLAGLWGSSWNTLQGLASELLGNDITGVDFKDNSMRKRRPLSRLNSVRSGSAGSQWGPAPTSNPSIGIGAGTCEEREAAIRAEKRKTLLLRGESSYADNLGKFKRRLSDEHESASAPPGDHDDRSALVYLHPVKKSDTLAGITIKYNISAYALRKANRMWPNDTVQSRDTLILPVAACGIKGRPVSDHQPLDLLSSESEVLDAGQAVEVSAKATVVPNGVRSHGKANSTSMSRHGSASSGTTGNPDVEPPWMHESWVLLPGDVKPTEIARLSRKVLGYFPPARRKSGSYSDLDTPSTSLELERPSIDNVIRQSAAGPSSSSSSPRRPGRLLRRLSNADSGYYPAYLAGPGGVGTMNKNVHYPGPAQDGLNKMFARYFSDVAPPRNQRDLYQPDMPLYSDNPTPTGSSTPNSSSNANLESFGGHLESWVRRVATQAKQRMNSTERSKARHVPRASIGVPGRGAGGVGDLIEMTNEFEIRGDETDEDEHDTEPQRGRSGSEVPMGQGHVTSSADYSGGGFARDRMKTSNGKASKAD